MGAKASVRTLRISAEHSDWAFARERHRLDHKIEVPFETAQRPHRFAPVRRLQSTALEPIAEPGPAAVNTAQLRSTIQPLRQTLLNHPIYKDLRTATALRTFMEYHVFAVWDFMSLLKTLQRRLSCVSVPWLPNSSLSGRRMVNEIVLAEESDADGQGGFASHFELYHGAMVAFGARTDGIDQFVNLLRDGHSIDGALQASNAHEPIRHFVKHTFDSIASEDLCGIASTFTFGREDLLPDVFQKIVQQLNQDVGGNLNSFDTT